MSSRNDVNAKKSGGAKNYWKSVKAEIRKVNWPSKKDLFNYTLVVIVTCVLLTLVIWGLDLLFQSLLKLVIN